MSELEEREIVIPLYLGGERIQRKIQGRVLGNLAVHMDVRGLSEFHITHLPSGLKLPFAFKCPSDAVRSLRRIVEVMDFDEALKGRAVGDMAQIERLCGICVRNGGEYQSMPAADDPVKAASDAVLEKYLEETP